MIFKARISAVGGYVPENVRSNSYLASITDTTDDWIVKRTGIEERRCLEDGLATSDMVVEALNDLLRKSNIEANDIDCLIVATSTPDMAMPSTANIVSRKMNIKNVFGFDVNAACSGFVYALTIGVSLLEGGACKNVVVVGADKMTSITNLYDRSTNILFGDGAGAILLQASNDPDAPRFIETIAEGNGEGLEFLNIEGGGSLYPASLQSLEDERHFLKQNGKVVFKNAVEKMTGVCIDILNQRQLQISDIDWFISHQANLRIIEAVGKNLEIDRSKVLTNVNRYGNTSAASIPLCLYDFQDQLKKGDRLLLSAFGAGFTWGSALVRWDI